MGWEDFFASFERSDLAFVYRDFDPSGELDNWHEFVKRAGVPELINSGRTTIVKKVL